MSRTYISEDLRKFVADRSNGICEYCAVPQAAGIIKFQCDHIISEKLGGETRADNLAFCCPFCNLYKGPNISSFSGVPPRNTPLFNPRLDDWKDHFFYTEDGELHSNTDIGKGTIFVLNINSVDRIIDRKLLFQNGWMRLKKP